MITCNATTLLKAASCFSCLPTRKLSAIRTYIFCQLAPLGVGLNIIPVGSKYGGGANPEFDLTVLANTSYTIMWGDNDLSMTLCGVNYPSTGAGTTTTVFTATCTLMQFFGTFAGTTVTARVHVNRAFIPIPGGASFTISAAGTQVTASWADPHLAFVNYAEVWTSADSFIYSLAATVNLPAVSTTFAAPASGSFLYVKIRFCQTGGTCGAFTSALGISGRAANWVARVQTNGGGAPSASTRAAVNTFDLALVTAGIDGRCQYVLMFAPDGLIAATTPLYKVTGNDPATNNGPFVAGDLTVNGLIGNGTTKWLNSGVKCTDWVAVSTKGGLACYTSTTDQTSTQIDIGNSNGGFNQGMDIRNNSSPGQCQSSFPPSGGSASTVIVNVANFVGFCLMTRSSGTDHRLYNASSTVVFSQIGSNATNTAAVAMQNTALGIFCEFQAGITPNFFSKKRHSFDAIFNGGFNASEGQALFNAVQALRVAFGGGFV